MDSQPLPRDELHEQRISGPTASQQASPLFRLPPELRATIFELASAEYEDPDPDRQYGYYESYRRPRCMAPRRCDTALLQTCRQAYREAWHLALTQKEHVIWAVWEECGPPLDKRGDGQAKMRHELLVRRARYLPGFGGVSGGRPTIESIQMYAQMCELEDSMLPHELDGLVLFDPRRLTLTIRHTDWWDWEDDAPLRFDGGWVPGFCDVLPPSLREIDIEMESTSYREDQLKAIAGMMRERWFFRTRDGSALFPAAEVPAEELNRWTGTDCDPTEEPGDEDFVVLLVRFRSRNFIEAAGRKVHEEVAEAAAAGMFDNDRMKLELWGWWI